MPDRSPADLRVLVSADGSSAELLFPENFDPASMNVDLCVAMLMQASVIVTEPVRQAVAAALQQVTQGIEHRAIVASATKPAHGRDGWIEWLLPELGHDPPHRSRDTAHEEPPPQGVHDTPATAIDREDHPAADNPASHYDRSAFVMVEPGTAIARVHPPTTGEDGQDVRGRTLAAKQGKPAPIKHDQSVTINQSGFLTAEVAGAVIRAGNSVAVSNLLDIPDTVDFSTGNIDFDGSVRIARGIKDLFEVRCRGNLEAGGLIEAATIECGGELLARGGMAGRERGSVRCGGSMSGRYFDAARIEVRGDLSFERELINCNTIVHGRVDAPKGSIIGGQILVVGSIRVACLGSRAGASTRITLARVPDLDAAAESIEELIAELDRRQASTLAEEKRLAQPGRKLTPAEMERKTELDFYAQNSARQRAKLAQAHEQALQRIAEISTIDVRVERALYHGVRFVVGQIECRITRDIAGPVRIVRSKDLVPHFRSGIDGPLRSLTDIGEISLLGSEAA